MTATDGLTAFADRSHFDKRFAGERGGFPAAPRKCNTANPHFESTAFPRESECITFVSQRPLTVSWMDHLNCLFTMVSSLGLEPRTHALKGRCSTN
jgi:hypothetical protein